VQEDYRWQWIIRAIPILPGATQVIHRRLAVRHDVHRIIYLRLFQAILHKEDVVGAVFNQEDGVTHKFGLGCNSIQKRLPVNPSDSTPTLPLIRSAALRTMASPIPVPSYCIALGRRSKMPKMRCWYCGLIPIPLSSIQSLTIPARRSVHTVILGTSP